MQVCINQFWTEKFNYTHTDRSTNRIFSSTILFTFEIGNICRMKVKWTMPFDFAPFTLTIHVHCLIYHWYTWHAATATTAHIQSVNDAQKIRWHRMYIIEIGILRCTCSHNFIWNYSRMMYDEPTERTDIVRTSFAVISQNCIKSISNMINSSMFYSSESESESKSEGDNIHCYKHMVLLIFEMLICIHTRCTMWVSQCGL